MTLPPVTVAERMKNTPLAQHTGKGSAGGANVID